jgi:hypothetical protein
MQRVALELLRAFQANLEAGDLVGLLSLFEPELRPVHPLPLDAGMEALLEGFLQLTDLQWGLASANGDGIAQVFSARYAGPSAWPPWAEGILVLRVGSEGLIGGLELFLEGRPPEGPGATLERLVKAFLQRDLEGAMGTFSPDVEAFGGLMDHRTKGRLALKGSVEAALQMTSLEVALTAWCGSRAARAWRSGALDARGNQAVVEGISIFDFGPDGLIARQESFLTVLNALRLLLPRRQG